MQNNKTYMAQLADYTRSSRDIAKEWNVSKTTVNNHRKQLKDDYEPGLGLVDENHTNEGSSYNITSERAFGKIDFENFIRARGQDPELVDFEWGVTSNPTGGFWNKLNRVRPKKAAELDGIDIEVLEARAQKVLQQTKQPKRSDNVKAFVVWADPQLGKTGSRGGTEQTIARSILARELVEDWLAEQGDAKRVLLDAGDGIEGFESGGNPMFTNDLSLPKQIELYISELSNWVNTVKPNTVGVVPSNHSAWRYGRQNLGVPGDDYGIMVHKIVAKNLPDVEFVMPSEHREAVVVEGVGLVHGNQFAPGRGVEWWKGQAFGNGPLALANTLVHGHYHTFEMRMAGVNGTTGFQRYLLSAPTLDNASDWYFNKVGVESEPGVMVFTTVDDVLDAGSVKFIRTGM